MKKITKFIGVCLIVLGVIFSFIQSHAQAKVVSLEKTFDVAKNVPIDKRWTVQFNKKINKDIDLDEFVFVEDVQHKKVPVEVSINNARTKVFIEPGTNYEMGETYKLIIKDGITSETGKKLKEQVVKQFTTMKEENKNSFFAQTYEATNDTNEQMLVALGKTDHSFIYQIVDEKGGIYKRESAKNTDEKDELWLPPKYKLLISYTSMPTIEPYGEEMELNFIPINQPAIEPIILNKGESLKVTSPTNYAISAEFSIGSTEDGLLPYIEEIDGEEKTKVGILKANELQKIGILFKQTIISNKEDHPIMIYNVTDKSYENIVMEKTFDSIQGFTLLQPGEAVEVTVQPESESLESIDLYATAFDENGSLQMAKYVKSDVEKAEDYIVRDSQAIVEPYFMDTTIQSITPKYEDVYVENTSGHTIAVYDAKQTISFKKSKSQLLQSYVIQPGEALNFKLGNANSLFSTDTYLKNIHYRELSYSSNNKGQRSITSVQETNTAQISEDRINRNQESMYISEDKTIVNLSDSPMTIYTPNINVTVKREKSVESTKLIMQPNQIIKINKNDFQSGISSVFIGTDQAYASFKYINTYVEDNIKLAEYHNEVLSDSYKHYWYRLDIDGEKYIQNTSENNLDIYIYDDDIQFTTVRKIPDFYND